MIDLAGKRALVTGAGTRVGAEIARALGACGMRVAVHHHGSAQGAGETCRDIEAAGGSALTFAADLYDESQARGLVDQVLGRFGGLDLLVSSAGNFDDASLATASSTHWDRALGLNVRAPFSLVQQAAPALQRSHGSVVLVTCATRLSPLPGYLPYQVSKAALHQLMRVLALELAPTVRVNSVAPGTVLPPAGMHAAARAELVRQIPLGTTGGASSVAQAVVYLAQASFVTGTEIVVDGGRSLAL
jgi:pteridine reductase